MKKIIGWLLLTLGVACWSIGLCLGFGTVRTGSIVEIYNFSDVWIFVVSFIGLLIIGSVCIALSLKINPEPFRRAIQDDEDIINETEPEAIVHNYSDDFDEIYTKLDYQSSIQKADRLIELIEYGKQNER